MSAYRDTSDDDAEFAALCWPPLDVEDPQPTSQELREDAHDARVEVLRTAHEAKRQ